MLDGSPINDIDSCGLKAIRDLLLDCVRRECHLVLAQFKEREIDSMKSDGVYAMLGEDHYFHQVCDASFDWKRAST